MTRETRSPSQLVCLVIIVQMSERGRAPSAIVVDVSSFGIVHYSISEQHIRLSLPEKTRSADFLRTVPPDSLWPDPRISFKVTASVQEVHLPVCVQLQSHCFVRFSDAPAFALWLVDPGAVRERNSVSAGDAAA